MAIRKQAPPEFQNLMTALITALLAAVSYLVATALLACSALKKARTSSSADATRGSYHWRIPAAIAVLFGSVLCWQLMMKSHGMQLSVGNSATLVCWTMALLLVVLSLRSHIENIGLILFPMAAVVGLATAIRPQTGIAIAHNSVGLQLHIVSSLLAYSLLSIAALQALFLALQEKRLRTHHTDGWLAAMPPMQSMEQWLFQLIAAGFLLLSLSLASGLIFLDNVFAQHLLHKLVFSVAAWLVFAVLLWGRWRYGWRGKRAVRFTLFGFILLALAYFGSKWVLEILLNESWS